MLKLVLAEVLLGVAVVVTASAIHKCPSNKFWSVKLDDCILCSKCDQSYQLKPCSQFNDTVCADEIKLSLDWLHPNKEKSQHFKKDRLHFINYEDDDDDESYDDLNDDDIDDDTDDFDESDFSDRKEKKKNKLKKKNKFFFDDNLDEDDDDNDDDFDSDEDDDRKRGMNDLDLDYKRRDEHFRFGTKDDHSLFKKRRNHLVFGDEKKYHKKKKLHKHWKDSDLIDEDQDDKDVYEKLQGLLIDRKNKLKHKKEDILKNLKQTKQSSSSDEKKFKLNHPNRKMFKDIFDDMVKHELHTKKEKRPKATEWDLLNDYSDRRDEDSLAFKKLLSNAESDSLDYKSVVPTHRMFLGEPSTVSEIIGQVKDSEFTKSSSDHSKKVVLEKSKLSSAPLPDSEDDEDVDEDDDEGDDNDVMSVPFTSAEALVWDWQAVSLVSAVGACLLFFVVAAIYILLTSREQTKRVKITDCDAEEMTTMIALMPELEREDRSHRNYIYRPTVVPKGASGHLTPYVHSKAHRQS